MARQRWKIVEGLPEKQYRTTCAHGKDEAGQLVVVVEEAHKLLNRAMAFQTTFAIIARELRKYYVTLLIVDQRPSQIHGEVMSQLSTRSSGWLGDDDDILCSLVDALTMQGQERFFNKVKRCARCDT
jgi:hypothetical protein